MYLETRDIGETMDIYSNAWRKGVKTTYYLHMKPRHTAEQSTVRVNKAEKMGQRGFAAVMEAAASVPAEERIEPKIVNAVASFIGPQVSGTKEEVTVSIPAEHSHQKNATTDDSHIMAPSDPQEKFLCDSCQ